jgi:hypothetical protein
MSADEFASLRRLMKDRYSFTPAPYQPAHAPADQPITPAEPAPAATTARPASKMRRETASTSASTAIDPDNPDLTPKRWT